MDSLAKQVRDNLVYYHSWQDVVSIPLLEGFILSGRPAAKLSNDDAEIQTEYIYPIELKQYNKGSLTLRMLDELFETLKDFASKRILLGIVSDDGTIVYYTVYKGLQKPKKN